LRHSALGIDTLNGRHSVKRAIAGLTDNIEPEPRNVIGAGPRRVSDDLRLHRAAIDVVPSQFGFVDVSPAQSRILPANRLAIEDQRGDRLPRLPGELVVS
jgi:hypothetical protein